MSKKISDLPAAGSAISTDQHEVNQGAISKRLTNAQIATFIETALSRVNLLSGNAFIHADGSASFAGNVVSIGSAGDISFGNGAGSIDSTGAIVAQSFSIAGGPTALNSDGSASFANGTIAFDAAGTVTIVTTCNFPSNFLLFAGGAFSIDGGTGEAGFASLRLPSGGPIILASGADQRAGNLVLVGGNATVGNTTVTANTIVMLTRKTSGGTPGTAVSYTLSPGVSFTVHSDNALDVSTFSYLLIEVP
jgi:hypothetical protein